MNTRTIPYIKINGIGVNIDGMGNYVSYGTLKYLKITN